MAASKKKKNISENPFHLELFIGGYGEYNYRLLLNAGKLIHWKESALSSESKQASVVHPTGKQWERFWKFIGTCRNWKKSYVNDLEVYGIEWEVVAQKKFVDIQSSGKDLYPENFEEFIKEVQLLMSGKTFGYNLKYEPEWFEAI